MVRFLFRPPADQAAALLTQPWELPLEEWTGDQIIEVRQRGISRHVVRFVADESGLYALKEIYEPLARREYRLLREFADLGLPAVEVMGIVVGRVNEQDAVLVTRFLEYSTSYRALFASPRGGLPTDRLLDAMVELLARLHLAGIFWGDCSLSNTLFRLDAGKLAAYLVDAETAERHTSLSDGQRWYDLDLARERVAGELMDLQAGDLLPEDVDPIEVANELTGRYDRLWSELTLEEVLAPSEQRYRIAQRMSRLNQLGFDVDEVELVSTPDGNRVRLKTQVAEPGHHRRQLFMRTGLDVEENQARRLLNDMASFRAHLEQKEKHPVPETVAANRWLAEVYDAVLSQIPDHLSSRLAPAEIFHEILEHRWYLSEAAGRDVGTTAAARSYFTRVLPTVPATLTSASPAGPVIVD